MIIIIAWIQSIVATIGSLYFSDILGYAPCVLCWYQRICMYPLVFLLAIGYIRKDTKLYTYTLPLVLLGWMIALYHCLLYYKILPASIETCKFGISCTTKYIEYFGFITIPLLSFTAFTVIGACLLIQREKAMLATSLEK